MDVSNNGAPGFAITFLEVGVRGRGFKRIPPVTSRIPLICCANIWHIETKIGC